MPSSSCRHRADHYSKWQFTLRIGSLVILQIHQANVPRIRGSINSEMRLGEGILRGSTRQGQDSTNGQANVSIQVDTNHLSALASENRIRRCTLRIEAKQDRITTSEEATTGGFVTATHWHATGLKTRRISPWRTCCQSGKMLSKKCSKKTT